MGEIAIQLIKISVRVAFVMGGIFGFVVLLNFAFSLVFITLNGNILTDLFALIQIWLPFNLSVILGFIIVASTSYVFYKLALVALRFVNSLVG